MNLAHENISFNFFWNVLVHEFHFSNQFYLFSWQWADIGEYLLEGFSELGVEYGVDDGIKDGIYVT